ncbi:hypothetical protein [Albimonas pacifica]|uniref:Uncharacterized protein n=1 Tax=Albimonas pacifica TaxID=1114924 RepID=A0A1I3LYG1_9RHOB|nr:hypothetical protein [Albimonas pacifica]SFI89743.1 hypothetical protein SAMN05216258_110231 [Albimonas pacifica]
MSEGMGGTWPGMGGGSGAALLARWAETLIAGALAVTLLGVGVSAGLNGGWLGWGIAALGLPAAAWAVVAFSRGRLKGAGEGPGVVEVAEGRIAYLAPEGHEQFWGGVVRVEELWTVEAVLLKRNAGLAWRLRPIDGLPVVISVGARGADRIPEALTALPGFSVMRAAKAFEHGGLGVRPIWRRSVHGRGFL